MSRFILSVTSVVLLSSCGALGGLGDALEPYKPKVRFDRLQLNAINFSEVSVDFLFAVDNPNPIKVTLDRWSYKVEFDGKQLVKGTNDNGFALEARGTDG
jgi:LEA14-like dessication related protein